MGVMSWNYITAQACGRTAAGMLYRTAVMTLYAALQVLYLHRITAIPPPNVRDWIIMYRTHGVSPDSSATTDGPATMVNTIFITSMAIQVARK